MTTTMRELAKAAGVSMTTVSRVLNNSSHPVSENKRKLILSLAEELGYQPNKLARSLRTDKTFTVGIIADNITSPFTPIIIRGIHDNLKGDGYFSFVINADWDPEVEKKAIHELISRSVDGVIFVESWLRGPNSTLDIANKPYVFVHRLFGGEYPNSVMVDDNHGASLAVDHLINLGHSRIAYINGPIDWDASCNRYAGFLETLKKNGIQAPEPQLIEEGDWELQSGYRAAKKFLKLSQPPTAIFAANDLMALGAIYAIQEEGLEVPKHIAVVGYDNREISYITKPTITTVTLPCYEIGQASSSLLLNLLKGKSNSPKPIKIQGELIVRESCGAMRERIPFEEYRTRTTPRQLLRKRIQS